MKLAKLIDKYNELGEDKFYHFLLVFALKYSVTHDKDNTTADIYLLNMHDELIFMYRKSGTKNYLDIAKIFRKAANKVYRIFIKKELVVKNTRFLNIVV